MARGTQYAGADDPAIPSDVRRYWERRGIARERREAWVAAENERWREVSSCQLCSRGLVAEEVRPHLIGHLSSRVRVLARMAEVLSSSEREELRTWLSSD